MNGHEMLYVIPAGVEVLGLKYRETGYNADIKGTFTCDDAFFTGSGNGVPVPYILPCATIIWIALIANVRSGGEMK